MEGRDGERQGLPMPVGADPLFLAKTDELALFLAAFVRALKLMRPLPLKTPPPH